MDISKVKMLIASYNKFIEDISYEKDIANDDYSNEEKEWMNQPSELTEGKAPAEITAEIENECKEEEIGELYRYAADNSFWSIPAFIMDILKKSGDVAVNFLMKILEDGEKYIEEDALQDVGNEDISDFECFVATLRLAPEMHSDVLDGKIISMYGDSADTEEIMDAFETAFIKMDTEKVTAILDSLEYCSEKDSTVAQALVSSGKKSDEIFNCLKKAFKKADDKELFGMILADYGDGRAVTVLRKEMIRLAEIYTSLPPEREERETVFKAMMLYNSFIINLGGTTDDIMK